MRNKIGVLVSLLVSMCLLLSGCKLAKSSENGTTNTQDQLCGFFVTQGHLALEYSPLQESRIYATKQYNTMDNSVEYVFEGLDGVPFYQYLVEDEQSSSHTVIGEENCSYWDSMLDDSIHDRVTALKSTDSGEECGIKGTLYYVPQRNTSAIYFYPVFQNADEVYLVLDQLQGISSDGAGSFTHTQSNTSTSTINGVETSLTTSAELTVEAIDELQYLYIKEMSDTDALLATHKITKEEANKEITLLPETKYLITEEHSLEFTWDNDSSSEVVKRTLYDRAELFANEELEYVLQLNFCNEKGFVGGDSITLVSQ